MKSLLALLTLLVSLSVSAADSLPSCEGSDSTKWHNCISDLSPYSGPGRGPYKNGKRHGGWSGGPTDAGEKWSVTYVNGEIEGTLHAFAHASESISNYKDGKLHGEQITFWADPYLIGNQRPVQRQGTYENGVPVGVHYFHTGGEMIITAYSSNGVELEKYYSWYDYDGSGKLRGIRQEDGAYDFKDGEISLDLYQYFVDDINKNYREATKSSDS